MIPEARPTLLIVDDDASIRTTLSLVFTQLGYSVRSASDGFSALARIHESAPDILLSDLNMPGMSGFELLSVVRRLYPAIHVIATSGAFSGEAVPHGVAADRFYEKASGLSFLFETVKQGASAGATMQRPLGSLAPMWMSPTGRLASNESYVLMGCPCCLRAFPQVLVQDQAIVCETECVYCAATISYAIVPLADPATRSAPMQPIQCHQAQPDGISVPFEIPSADCHNVPQVSS